MRKISVEVDNRIELILNFLKKYDEALYNHCVRTADIAAVLAQYLNYDKRLLYNAGLIHDIGKVGIVRSFFVKPGRLTEIEREAMDLHSFIGYSIASNMGVEKDVCLLILFHHGFNKNNFNLLKEADENIKYMSEILRIADAYDALTSNRIYSPALSHSTSIKILYKNRELNKEIINELDKLFIERRKYEVS